MPDPQSRGASSEPGDQPEALLQPQIAPLSPSNFPALTRQLYSNGAADARVAPALQPPADRRALTAPSNVRTNGHEVRAWVASPCACGP